MPVVNGNYEQLTSGAIRRALEDELQVEFGEDIDLTESSVFTTLTESLATVLSENQEQSLEDVYNAAFLDTATGEDLDRVVSLIGIQRRNAKNATGVQQFQASGPVSASYTVHTQNVSIGEQWYEITWDWSITDNIGITVNDGNSDIATLGGSDTNISEGVCGFKSSDAAGTKRFDFYTTSAVSANIRAIIGGEDGNVGPNSITSRPSPTSGVAATTNLYPTGTTTFTDRDGALFILGEDEESDEELRSRAQDTVTGGGDATHDAIVAELINNTEGVTSVTIYENKTGVDNTGSGGLPPYSFEVVVFGGEDEAVARSIFDKKAVTARDYSGANGTSVTKTITAESNSQQRDIEFSRPSKISIDITLDIIINDSYVGDNDIKDQIVEYIGGILTDETERVGLGVSEDVIIDRITDIVVGQENGVVGLDQSVDGDPIETTPSTQTIDGLNVVQIGQSEVGQTDASSITINKREQ